MTEARDAMRPRRPRESCGRCGASSWLPIAYGFPGPGMMELAERGKIELGGCVIEQDAPTRRCRRCAHLHGRPMEWDGVDGPRDGEFADWHRVILSEDVPGTDADEPELTSFALSFDGYAAFEADALGAVADRTRTAFEKRGSVPDSLVVLRACLFFEQRIARANNGTLRTPYVAALLEAIRTQSRHLEETT